MSLANLPPKLRKELKNKFSLTRLAKVGFFKKADPVHISIQQELLLYRAVLDRALLDMFSSDKQLQQDILDWLDLDNPDFTDTCELAMLDPEGVYEAFQVYRKTLKGDKAKFHEHGFLKKSTNQPNNSKNS